MKEIRKSLKMLFIYYLLVFISIPFQGRIIPSRYPFTDLSSLYLIALCCCLLIRYHYRITPRGLQKPLIRFLVSMCFLLIFLRTVKYTVVSELSTIPRYIWYLYYLPLLMMPQLFLMIALLVYRLDRSRRFTILSAITLTFTISSILLVLTNDLHQLVFRFQPDFRNWDSDYSYGFTYYVIIIWQYLMFLIGAVILIRKSRTGSARSHFFLICTSFLAGLALLLLVMTGAMSRLTGYNMLEFQEVYCLMIVSLLEVCIQLGLIPSNEKHSDLFYSSSVPAQITDSSGKVVYRSHKAPPLTPEEFRAEDNSRIKEHTILRKATLNNGYAFWMNDVSELDKLNADLLESRDRLSEEVELIRLQNELMEKQAKVKQRSLIYDTIARSTQKHSLAISHIAEEALCSSDVSFKDKCRKTISLYSAYIKRYANLMLQAEDDSLIETGELALSVSEVLLYLNAYGIPGDLLNNSRGEVQINDALAAFEVFDDLIMENLSFLKGVLVNIQNNGSKVLLKLTLEALYSAEFLKGLTESLQPKNISMEATEEDEITFISISFPEGGCR